MRKIWPSKVKLQDQGQNIEDCAPKPCLDLPKVAYLMCNEFDLLDGGFLCLGVYLLLCQLSIEDEDTLNSTSHK